MAQEGVRGAGGGQASNTIIMPVGMLFVSSGHFILVARRAASGVLRAASVATASKKCNKAAQLIFDYATTAAATMRGSSSNHRQQHSEAAQIVNKNKPNISLSVSLSGCPRFANQMFIDSLLLPVHATPTSSIIAAWPSGALPYATVLCCRA